MSELIKREDAIKITWQEPQYYDPINALTEVREKIRALPTVDAVPISYIYEKASELKNDDMIYAYTVLNSLIANYRADRERKEQDDATN